MSNNELMEVKGGSVKWGVVGVIAGTIVSFVIGVIDGYLRPLKCN